MNRKHIENCTPEDPCSECRDKMIKYETTHTEDCRFIGERKDCPLRGAGTNPKYFAGCYQSFVKFEGKIHKNKDGLKLCPFCARQPKFYYFQQNTDNEIVTVECDCGATNGKNSHTKLSARQKWNRRRLSELGKNT